MNDDELKFLAEVRKRCYGDTQMTERIIHSAITGMSDKAADMRFYASEMETVAAMTMNNRLFKGNERFLAEKLETTARMHSLNWTDQIEKLKDLSKQKK